MLRSLHIPFAHALKLVERYVGVCWVPEGIPCGNCTKNSLWIVLKIEFRVRLQHGRVRKGKMKILQVKQE